MSSPKESGDIQGLTPEDHGSPVTPTDHPIDTGPPRCVATVRSTGERCKKFPIRYSTVCLSHGGAAGQVRRKAREREQTALALVTLQREGYAPLEDPVDALLQIASEFLGLKDVLADQVAQLTQISSVDRQGTEAISAVLAAYQAALKETGEILVKINRLGLQERRIDIERERLDLMFGAVRRGIWSEAAALEYDDGVRIMRAIDAELSALPVAE